MCVRHHYSKQTQITYIKHDASYKQRGVKTNRTSFYAEIATDIITWNSELKDTIGQYKTLKMILNFVQNII